MPIPPSALPRTPLSGPTRKAVDRRRVGSRRRAVAILVSVLALVLPLSTPVLAEAAPQSGTRSATSVSRTPGWETRDKSTNSSMETINSKIIRSTFYWAKGYTGAGVTVALIDTGVVPVNGLTADGKLVNGPDLSFDGPNVDQRYLDLFGHGTHMAGIIAGRDDAAPTNLNAGSAGQHFLGVAPDAQILNVKVGDGVGASNVSQVIAGLNWVVTHRYDAGMNVRVINLAYGIDPTTDYQNDELAYAVEAAWKAGIVVVVAAGNDGNDLALRNPAFDPFVLSVGAVDTNGTQSTKDDIVPAFSNCGTASRSVDVLAPGISVISLRDPGSFADFSFPEARVGERFFRGTGTSQATAVVSGAAALLLQQRPELTPDQVKALLTSTAQRVPGAPALCGNAGLIDMQSVFQAPTPSAVQTWAAATNSTAYDAVVVDGDWGGQTWGGQTWGGQTWGGQTWGGQTWGGQTWGGQTWGGQTWGGQTWGSFIWN